MNSQQWDHCLTCQGTIIPPNTPVQYAGKICYCPIRPEFIEYQRPASKESNNQSVFKYNHCNCGKHFGHWESCPAYEKKD